MCNGLTVGFIRQFAEDNGYDNYSSEDMELIQNSIKSMFMDMLAQINIQEEELCDFIKMQSSKKINDIYTALKNAGYKEK